jgi:hypothetical protein
MDTKSSMHVLVDLNLATAVARPAVVYIYARAAQLRGVARGNLSKNSFFSKNFKKGGRDRHHENQVPFWSTQVPFWHKKKGAAISGHILAPQGKKGRFLFPTNRAVSFRPGPYFGPCQNVAGHGRVQR